VILFQNFFRIQTSNILETYNNNTTNTSATTAAVIYMYMSNLLRLDQYVLTATALGLGNHAIIVSIYD
jgi:hypothetical protein